MAHFASNVEHEPNTVCQLKLIGECPSASILRVLLKRMSSALHSTTAPTTKHDMERDVVVVLDAVMEKFDYSATKLLDDVHHLKYGHGIDSDDTKFDEAFAFFNDSLQEYECDINKCPFVKRHFRDRGLDQGKMETMKDHTMNDDVLLDAMAMIHCYFVHSYDINRLTKEERDRVDEALSSNVTEDDEEKLGEDMRRSKLLADILREKQQKLHIARRSQRYFEHVDTELNHDDTTESVDFASMSRVVKVDESTLREALGDFAKGTDRLIEDLIDIVYGQQNVEDRKIWRALKVAEDEKEGIFRRILYDHFKCAQLSNANLVKMCHVIVHRMELQIDIDALNEVLTSNGIDGRIYDKTNPETCQSVNDFAQKFKPIQNCKEQHVRRMYNMVRKWKYIKSKQEKAIKKQLETVDDGKEDEKESGAKNIDKNIDIEQEHSPTVYEIGKQFYFWESLKEHPDFVRAKRENMKEEVLHSPLFRNLVSLRAWNKLTKDIEVMLATECALRTTSNGISFTVYRIHEFEPLDAEHLRALKLYTDFDKFCAKFCTVLRSGDPVDIAEMAHVTRTLIETVQCYGNPLDAERTKKTYYRGVNRSFLFKTIATKFNLPFSTTNSVKSFMRSKMKTFSSFLVRLSI